MGTQTVEKIKKTIAILLAVFFVISATNASISAIPSNRGSGYIGFGLENGDAQLLPDIGNGDNQLTIPGDNNISGPSLLVE
jgi:hypothetical protein